MLRNLILWHSDDAPREFRKAAQCSLTVKGVFFFGACPLFGGGSFSSGPSRPSRRFSNELLVGQTAPDDIGGDGQEAARIVQLAPVETERLFVDVPEQVEGLDAHGV